MAESDKAMENSTFDPVNLLQAGLLDLKDRALSIQCLRRSRTVNDSVPYLTTSLAPIPNANNDITLIKPWIKPTQESSASSSASVVNALPSQEHQEISSTVDINPLTPEEYYSSLAVAPHASLIHIVMLYHQSMCKYGLSANLLKGLKESDGIQTTSSDLEGMDLLLKDGLLSFYLRIQPYLPPVPSQVLFWSLNYK